MRIDVALKLPFVKKRERYVQHADLFPFKSAR